MANRLKFVLQDHLHKTRYCGVPGNSILDAVTHLRDALAYSESTATPLCVLSLHLKQAFYLISHQYLFKILPAYGITPWFLDSIKAVYVYTTASASVQINGMLRGLFPINSGARQGIPISPIHGKLE
jgi:hypothetical protein